MCNGEQKIYAYDLLSGDRLWQAYSGWMARFATDGKTLYASSGDEFFALDPATGEELWSFDTGDLARAPILHDGVAYFGSDDCYLYALKLK